MLVGILHRFQCVPEEPLAAELTDQAHLDTSELASCRDHVETMHAGDDRLATQLGRSRADIAHTVRLLDLPDQAIELIDTGMLSKGHGKALLTEPDHHRRRVLARRAADAGWSVRALEAEIARRAKPRSMQPEAHPDHEAAAARLQDTIARALGSDVSARPYRDGYQVVLGHAAGDRLRQLLAAMSTSKQAPVPRGTP